MNDQRFPDSFLFGGAICAMQAEGGFDLGGRGLSNGDLRKKGLGTFNDFDVIKNIWQRCMNWDCSASA